MNTNTLLAQTVAELQKQLQAIHKKLGAPKTQNVRNIEPAHVTIVSCLPTRKNDSISSMDLYVKFVEKGGLASLSSFRCVLSALVAKGCVNTICYCNKSGQYYYFGLK